MTVWLLGGPLAGRVLTTTDAPWAGGWLTAGDADWCLYRPVRSVGRFVFEAAGVVGAGVVDAGHHGVVVVEFHLAEGSAGDGWGVVVGDDQLQAFAVRVGYGPEAAVDFGRALPVGVVVAEGLAR